MCRIIIILKTKTKNKQKQKNVYNRPTRNPEVRSCVKVEVAVLGSPSLIVRTVSVDIKQS